MRPPAPTVEPSDEHGSVPETSTRIQPRVARAAMARQPALRRLLALAELGLDRSIVVSALGRMVVSKVIECALDHGASTLALGFAEPVVRVGFAG